MRSSKSGRAQSDHPSPKLEVRLCASEASAILEHGNGVVSARAHVDHANGAILYFSLPLNGVLYAAFRDVTLSIFSPHRCNKQGLREVAVLLQGDLDMNMGLKPKDRLLLAYNAAVEY